MSVNPAINKKPVIFHYNLVDPGSSPDDKKGMLPFHLSVLTQKLALYNKGTFELSDRLKVTNEFILTAYYNYYFTDFLTCKIRKPC